MNEFLSEMFTARKPVYQCNFGRL